MHDMKPQLLPPFISSSAALFDFCVFLQGEAERASPGEAEIGGEDHGPVQGSGSQHAPSSQQGQVTYSRTPAGDHMEMMSSCSSGGDVIVRVTSPA